MSLQFLYQTKTQPKDHTVNNDSAFFDLGDERPLFCGGVTDSYTGSVFTIIQPSAGLSCDAKIPRFLGSLGLGRVKLVAHPVVRFE